MRIRSTPIRSWTLVALLALGLGACSGLGGGASGPAAPAGSTGSSGNTLERWGGSLFGPRARPGEGMNEQTASIDCPPIDVRQGASTIIVHGAGEQNSTNVRWQASVGQTARECALLGATVTMKVGMQGRVIVGPAGGPGRLDVPIRFALVREGPEPKTIWTQLYRVPVDIPAGQTNVPFVHVEDNLTFPKPTDDDADALVVYVGFDQTAQRPPERRRQRGARAANR